MDKYILKAIKVDTLEDYLKALKEGYCVFIINKDYKDHLFIGAMINMNESLDHLYIYASLLKDKNDIENNQKEYFKIISKLAKKDYIRAYFDLSMAYYNGIGVKTNKEKMMYWLNKALENKYPPAENALAAINQKLSKNQNEKQIFLTYLKLAKRGYRSAERNAAICYIKGYGVKKSYKKAAEWLIKASEQELGPAQNNLANLYFEGKGVKKSITLALFYYMKAKENGVTSADKMIRYISNINEVEERENNWFKVDHELHLD